MNAELDRAFTIWLKMREQEAREGNGQGKVKSEFEMWCLGLWESSFIHSFIDQTKFNDQLLLPDTVLEKNKE